MKNAPITKKISDDQSVEYQKVGKGINVKFFWFGNDWLRFAKMLAKIELEQHVMNYFLGAVLNVDARSVMMRNAFAFDNWMDRHAIHVKDWNFQWNGEKALRLPRGDEEYSSLGYHIAGHAASEYWNSWIEAYSKPDDSNPKLLL